MTRKAKVKTERPNLIRGNCRMCILRQIDENYTKATNMRSRKYWASIKKEQLEILRGYITRQPRLCGEITCIERWSELRTLLKTTRLVDLRYLKQRVKQAEYKLQECIFKTTKARLSSTIPIESLKRLEYYESLARLTLAQRKRRLNEALHRAGRR